MHEGGCLCGNVRFEVAQFKGGVFKCHCSKCRKAFGGASSAATLAAADDFRWLQGEQGIREYQCESGFKRRFCPDCGSILPQSLVEAGLVWLPAGLLDSDPGLTLRHHIHVDSKAAWERLDDEARHWPEGFT